MTQTEYRPDDVSPPGETLLEALEDRGMTQVDLAQRTGRPKKTINEIVKGKTAITPETALQFERVLGIPATFWNNREQQYREALARREDEQRLKGWENWLTELPVKRMIAHGWVKRCEDKAAQVLEMLTFFGVASPDAYHAVFEREVVAFRKAGVSATDKGATAAWLRQGEIEATEIDCAPHDERKFHAALRRIRTLTTKPAKILQVEVVRLCAEAGVAVVFIPELPRTGICGATRWLTPAKALLQLSLRYKTDDQLWFSFFHEAGHILLHRKRKLFVEREHVNSSDEAEADEFSRNLLIPLSDWQRFISSGQYHAKADISDFAEKVGIAPGIVVGRLQHETLIPFSHCDDLKRRLRWVTERNGAGEEQPE
ncbi:MAG: helix-turn-helix domain-containing protein [Ktedonobacterales bacterium]|nr:helix-turn-helix domain-containing protein [Ktedonobacterales bacterium]